VRASAELPRFARAVGWVGAILFWSVQLTLLYVFELPLADTILLAALLAAVPALAVMQVAVVAEIRIERLQAYWASIMTLWLLGSAAWLVGTRSAGARALGFVPLPPAAFAAWTVGLTVGALGIILLFREIAARAGTDESSLLRELLPRTPREKSVFALLSVAAGVGEEAAYRGYAIPLLAGLMGAPAAAALTSIVFGVLHAYQGWLGGVRTALIGGFFAWGFLAAGSLWPVVVAHTAVDLLAGLVLGERLLPQARPAGVVGALDGPDLNRER
jgi:membrane protease YdiL (CAAX protease family)